MLDAMFVTSHNCVDEIAIQDDNFLHVVVTKGEYMTPAQLVIEKFGGVRATARVLGINPSTVCRWNKTKQDGGTDGFVPQNHFKQILSHLEISLQELCFGRD